MSSQPAAVRAGTTPSSPLPTPSCSPTSQSSPVGEEGVNTVILSLGPAQDAELEHPRGSWLAAQQVWLLLPLHRPQVLPFDTALCFWDRHRPVRRASFHLPFSMSTPVPVSLHPSTRTPTCNIPHLSRCKHCLSSAAPSYFPIFPSLTL